ncbi:MAG: 50S ribosomal protein L17 [Rickettsiales bacterium]|nr:50S ribosomal protein L17 [Rickettsiales bacterium]
MRHRKGLKKLNRTSSHRQAMLANMAESLLKHERIKTTLVNAKALRPYVEKIITKAKAKSLATVRYLSSIFHDSDTVKKLTDDIGQRVAKRQGGYTRIYKIGFRSGDTADMALIELVDRAVVEKKSKGTEKAMKTVEATAAPVKEVNTEKLVKKSAAKPKITTDKTQK